VRLEPLCKLTMHYRDASWHQPYGNRDDGAEQIGFGHGDGAVTGEIEGQFLWANAPRRRQDGVWTPNLRGMIRTVDGHELIVSIHGQSIDEIGSERRRAILARIEFTTEAPPYRWLNTSFLVGEGAIDGAREGWWIDVFVCIHQQSHGSAALGIEPPERFRA
jgi:hypothetical protein